MAKGKAVILLLLLAVLGADRMANGAKPDVPTTRPGHPDMIVIPAGAFIMGNDHGPVDERPAHRVSIHSFLLDRHEVTVAQFQKFIEATHYRTDADQWGWAGVFDHAKQGWMRVDGANWQHPESPSTQAADNEPVRQVSYNDALAYAKWAGKRLPTEAEFEYAARGGLEGKLYAWGDTLRPGGKYMANWWQGTFPDKDTGDDGFTDVAPVCHFPANGYGLYDMTGNVWEWCSDWYDAGYYAHSLAMDPAGPSIGTERVLRGGSFLCAENFCSNYRVAGRMHSPADSGLNNVGFRCAADLQSTHAPMITPAPGSTTSSKSDTACCATVTRVLRDTPQASETGR